MRTRNANLMVKYMSKIDTEVPKDEQIASIRQRIKETENEIGLLEWDIRDYKEWIVELENDE